MTPSLLKALIGFFPAVAPEMVLGVVACVLFLGGTWRASRNLWGAVALAGLAAAALALWGSVHWLPTAEATRNQILPELQRRAEAAAPGEEKQAAENELKSAKEDLSASTYASPVQHSYLAVLIKVIALVGGAVLVLCTWHDMPADQAADYHACLLLIVAGIGLTGAANDLVLLFLALELVSIPTYVMLYLPRVDTAAQEAAMKYFLLSVFSSALTLFGFSYLYGLSGTTNMPAVAEALSGARAGKFLPGVTLIVLVMVVAGLGFRIAAVPFHFYAPDVYQGTTTGNAALLAFVPKVAGFAALFRVLGFIPPILAPGPDAPGPALWGRVGLALGEQAPVLLWIVAAVTMSLGNVLGLLQDNVKRMLAYSSVAHAGYMLIGLAVAPRLTARPEDPVGGVEAVLFYLIAYSAMTIGAFAVLNYLSTPEQPVETVEDLAGLGRSRTGSALLMALFLFSLIGIPLTAGFMGKLLLFFGAMGVPAIPGDAASLEQSDLYKKLALIGALNAAVGAWYYLRVCAVMFLREPTRALAPARRPAVLAAIAVCAVLTVWGGVYPRPILRTVQDSVPHVPAERTPPTLRVAADRGPAAP